MNLQAGEILKRRGAPSLRGFDRSRDRPGASHLRLQTLVRLRWLAVIGQTVAVMTVYFGLGFPLPLGLCLAAIAMSAWLNIFLSIRYRANLRLRNRYAALMLSYDTLQLAALLYLTGGLQNPFSFLFLVPATVSASALPLRHTITLGVLTFGLATLLAVFHLPLPWVQEDPLVVSVVYVAGIWTALVCGLGFLGFYVWRISEETKRMSDALGAAELVLAHEQQLSALDGLAAAAAHKLGTPLATIALVAKELKRGHSKSEQYEEDVDLLISQANRCREILSTLTLGDDTQDRVFGHMKLGVMLEELAEPHRIDAIAVDVDAAPEPGATGAAAQAPVLARNPGVLYGLANILDNAHDFAASRVLVSARWSNDRVVVTIEDDGPGFAQDIVDKLGEPYVTTRPAHGPKADIGDAGYEGMGLGFFIAKTLLERSGAVVALANRPAPAQGAVVSVIWPRAVLDVEYASG